MCQWNFIFHPSFDPMWATCCPSFPDPHEAKSESLAHVFISPKSSPCQKLCRGGETFHRCPLYSQATVRNCQAECALCREGCFAELHFAHLTRDMQNVANHG